MSKDSANSRLVQQGDCTTDSTTIVSLAMLRGGVIPPRRNNRAGRRYICRGSHTDEVLCVKCYITDIIDITPSGWLAVMLRDIQRCHPQTPPPPLACPNRDPATPERQCRVPGHLFHDASVLQAYRWLQECEIGLVRRPAPHPSGDRPDYQRSRAQIGQILCAER